MIDPEIMVDILREFAAKNGGRDAVDMSTDIDRCHHIELLEDAGHMTWVSEYLVRITNDGYDFLNAIDSQQEAMSGYLDALAKGVDYLRAAEIAIEIASTLAGAA